MKFRKMMEDLFEYVFDRNANTEIIVQVSNRDERGTLKTYKQVPLSYIKYQDPRGIIFAIEQTDLDNAVEQLK